MLAGKLDRPDTYAPFLTHPVWEEALHWLRAMPAGISSGIHQLRGDHLYANVHGYDTKLRGACRYESHRRYLDLQYCISGGECIEWQPLDALKAKDDYDAVKDVRHYHSPEQPAGVLRLSSGTFAIFRPEDGHMPKIADGIHPAIAKVVLKLDVALFL